MNLKLDIGMMSSNAPTRIALTFDDGPNGPATRSIVDLLVRYHAPATFFAVGRSIDRDPETLQYVHRHGFPIENHSWYHSFFFPFRSTSAIVQEIQRTNERIMTITGRPPTWLRPPHGWRSPMLTTATHHLGMRLINWNVDSFDYLTGTTSFIAGRVLNHFRSTSVVLLHDGLQDGPLARRLQNRQGTIGALEIILAEGRRRGWEFIRLDALA